MDEKTKAGIFDWLVIDDRPGFVHVWSHTNQRQIKTGELAGANPISVAGSTSFSVKLPKQSGYVNVNNGRLQDWSEAPTQKTIVDYLGQPVSVLVANALKTYQ